MRCAIVLAAGRSTRMGRQKLVLPFGDSTVIGCVVRAFLDAPVDEVVVVIRAGDNEVRAALAAVGPGSATLRFAENTDASGDMLSSVRCGLRALSAVAETILVTPGDLPALRADVVRDFLAAFTASGRGIGVPVFDGRRGHPIAFKDRYCEEVATSYEGTGLRGLAQSHLNDLFEWPAPNAGVLNGVNSWQQYEALKNRMAHERGACFEAARSA